jgi:hypothetical protein
VNVGTGGGSGGGILLHGEGVTLTGLLSAHGGDGGAGGFFNLSPRSLVVVGGGGGGAGGRVVIDPRPGGFADIGGTIDVSGGAGGGGPVGFDGGAGVINIVPELSSLVLMSTGLLALGWLRRRTASA